MCINGLGGFVIAGTSGVGREDGTVGIDHDEANLPESVSHHITLSCLQGEDHVVIWFEEPVTDVALSAVEYNYWMEEEENKSPFMESFTWFTADGLLPTDALCFSTLLPEGIPNLQISYTLSDGRVEKRIISWSGLTGYAVLSDPEIE